MPPAELQVIPEGLEHDSLVLLSLHAHGLHHALLKQTGRLHLLVKVLEYALMLSAVFIHEFLMLCDAKLYHAFRICAGPPPSPFCHYSEVHLGGHAGWVHGNISTFDHCMGRE